MIKNNLSQIDILPRAQQEPSPSIKVIYFSQVEEQPVVPTVLSMLAEGTHVPVYFPFLLLGHAQKDYRTLLDYGINDKTRKDHNKD